jgi:hypothetical protein
MSQESLYAQAALGGVPASVQSNTDIESLIRNISTPIDPRLISAATTPIPGAHTGQVPSNLTTPVAPHQNTPLDLRPTVGKGNARARGIGNAIVGVTNALGSVVTAEAQNKQNSIRDAATKVITAQQAIDEAQQQHDMALQNLKNAAPGSPEAEQYQKQVTQFQGVIDQNTKTRDGIFADPKMRKALVKGFDISYTDPQSNNTEEHKAVQAAMKQAKSLAEKKQIMQEAQQKAGAAAGAAYASQQPRGLTMDTAAQQRLAIAQGQQKIQQGVIKDILTYTAAMRRAEAPVDAAKIRGLYELQKQINSSMQKQNDMQTQFDYKMRFLQAQTAARAKLQWNELSVADAKEMDRLKMMSRDPLSISKMADESERTWQTQIESVQGRLTAATNQLTTLQLTPGATKEQISALQNEVDSTRLTLQQAQNKQAYWGGVMATYKKMAGLPDEQEGGSSGTGANSTGGTSANSIKSYTGKKPEDLINEINSGTLNFDNPEPY